jgi:hypothetical protein
MLPRGRLILAILQVTVVCAPLAAGQPGVSIVISARAFGLDDDITVLTLARTA